MLKLLLPGDGLLNVWECLEINELVTIIPVSKGRPLAGSVLCDTALETVCHTDVKHFIISVGHDICSLLFPCIFEMPGQAGHDEKVLLILIHVFILLP